MIIGGDPCTLSFLGHRHRNDVDIRKTSITARVIIGEKIVNDVLVRLLVLIITTTIVHHPNQSMVCRRQHRRKRSMPDENLCLVLQLVL